MTTMETLSAIIDQALERADPVKPFMVTDGKPLTYRQLVDRVSRLSGLLASKQLKTGNRVGIMSGDAAWAAVIMLASLRSGVAVINFNPEMTGREYAKALELTGLDHLFVDRDLLDTALLPDTMGHTAIETDKAGRGLMGRLLGRKANGAAHAETGGLRAEVEAAEPVSGQDAVPDETIGLMLLTSGTTSNEPKVVQLSHANLAAQLTSFSKIYDFDAESRILNPLPMHFTDGILHGPLVTLMSGATLYRPKKFEVQKLDELLDSIYRDRITHFDTVPAILSLIVRLGSEYKDAFQTPDFRYIRSSGDRLPESLWRSVQDIFGTRVVNTYGLSETVCESLYCGPAPETFRLGTIGKPIDCEIRIVDEEGQPAGEGQSGELLIRGPHIMVGYFNRPDLTRDVIDDEGWFRTGDIASMDADGFVTITGRKKEIIISGGINIQPREIADILLEHADVAEAHVVGVPDPVWGERIACAVVPANGSGTTDAQELIAYARDRLAPGKTPQVIRFMDNLPRNPAGKVLVADIKRALNGSGTANGSAVTGTTEERVLAIAARVFSCDASDVHSGSEPQTTLGWDSFAHLTLVSEVEREFGLKLSARDVLRISTLGRLADIVEQKQC